MSNFNDLQPIQQLEALQAAALNALQYWDGSFDQLELIKWRENAVYSVVRNDGKRFALRLHRAGYHSESALRSELEWMGMLSAGGIQVPEVIPTRHRECLVQVAVPGTCENRYVDMLAWLSGNPIGSAEAGINTDAKATQVMHQAGELAARIHLRSMQWPQPNGFVRHAWDEEGLIGEHPFWGPFWELELLDEQQCQLMQDIRRQARLELRRYGRTNQNFGMIHADFVPENLLLDNHELRLIDFDDAGFGWHLFELATALFFLMDAPDYPALKQSLLEGYHSIKPLTPEDYELLALFIVLRSLTYLGWVHTRSETDTAKELSPFFIQRACQLAEEYLQNVARRTLV
ncbi:UNVERIFIED_ORG: Ser/Thr protein kinase RdoA (MazF antagonist) [Pseudomonas putida]|nr:Ser/Thr protein kinase RdoA (MazF antagonist) [Pseudomonas putida]